MRRQYWHPTDRCPIDVVLKYSTFGICGFVCTVCVFVASGLCSYLRLSVTAAPSSCVPTLFDQKGDHNTGLLQSRCASDKRLYPLRRRSLGFQACPTSPCSTALPTRGLRSLIRLGRSAWIRTSRRTRVRALTFSIFYIR